MQHSSHQQRLRDTPCQLIQLPGQQADRKDESWKAKKEEKKQGQRERGEEGEGECPTVWIIISHWRRNRRSQRHSTVFQAGRRMLDFHWSLAKVITSKSSYCKGQSLGLDKKARLVSYTYKRLCEVWLTFSHRAALLYRAVSHTSGDNVLFSQKATVLSTEPIFTAH